jgi:hypothetical protein
MIHPARARRVLGRDKPRVSMPANREPLQEASDSHTYYYRRSLTTRDYLLAAGVGIGVGMAAFYLATRFAQRTPLLAGEPARSRKLRVKGPKG